MQGHAGCVSYRPCSTARCARESRQANTTVPCILRLTDVDAAWLAAKMLPLPSSPSRSLICDLQSSQDRSTCLVWVLVLVHACTMKVTQVSVDTYMAPIKICITPFLRGFQVYKPYLSQGVKLCVLLGHVFGC
ncbi:hypothetical protein CCHR01_12194 [Colletotrichum chrysophilum]|uniref:Uncharacterized protein n=1 Tax=Colletotrichum chrysophilum TaxID=1836956 RepID=A0AAD9AGK4_9PEZI|nr:hypothetical protein CCHR01_12194 [Colletotrichum chrysophilum]